MIASLRHYISGKSRDQPLNVAFEPMHLRLLKMFEPFNK